MNNINNDPRLIPFGKIIRKLQIDELPQLINVLLGELSFIGPRPGIPYEVAEDLLWHRKRFDVTPGMIGLLETNGKNRLTYDEMIRLDIRYTQQRSFWFDIKILINTVVAVVSRTKDIFSVRSVYITTKPLLDCFAAIIGLIIFLPVFLIVGVMIKITSKGPVFYSQERVGKNGRIFEIIKFRTMHVNAESQFGPIWAKKDDPRISIIGRILRKTHIDELPQLFNVVNGEMSIIGPRPERLYFVEKFIEDIPDYTKRLTVKPGITGLAQCCHKYDEIIRDVERKLRYDILYTKKMCWSLDFKILLLTIKVSLF